MLQRQMAPMLARSQDEIPRESGWLYEPKWDGFRSLVFRENDVVEIISRNGQPLHRYFPELIEPLRAALPAASVTDGEIIIPAERGLDFDALSQRIHPAASRVAMLARETPATYVAFDLLCADDSDLTGAPLAQRRQQLVSVLSFSPQVHITPQTADAAEASRWFTQYEGAGLDGIVAKKADSPYLPGERGWIKVKHERTADCVVGGFRLAKDDNESIGSLLLGLYDSAATLHHVGHTSSFTAAARKALREELRSLEGGMSFGHGRIPGGPSRWAAGKDTNWIALRPERVCEVAFEHLQGNRFRHAARFLRWRPDKDPSECTYDQLVPPHPFKLQNIFSTEQSST